MKEVKVGQVFKNYKDLCNHLGETVKGGKSKELQVMDWKRYFEFEKDKNKFIITNVYNESLKKVTNRTSNNIKNIQPMMEYIQGMGNVADCFYYSMTAWYCDQLRLLKREICDVIYKGNLEVEEYCIEHHILNKRILSEYVSAARSCLKNMFRKALSYMEKKDLVEYEEGYMFTYRLGKKSLGHFATTLLNEIIITNETDICNAMNREHNLSDKFNGRQNLYTIYSREPLLEEFRDLTVSMIMDDENIVNICNRILNEDNGQGTENISEYHPLLSYYSGISIIGIEIVDADIQSLGMEICNIIRRKTRQQMFKKKYINKFTGREVYPYHNEESAQDILQIEQLLFSFWDEDMEDDSNLDLILLNSDLPDKETTKRTINKPTMNVQSKGVWLDEEWDLPFM